ncbi:MAG TPA: papain-like cysteine protease family protein [Sphingomicrobium sp.]|nr:papain-like cysteine protease family protein [Sphingomicrobium sp.]
MSIALAKGTPIPVTERPLDGILETNFTASFSGPTGLAIDYVAQEQDQWCWAACFQMIGGYLGFGGLGQLEMARRVFGSAACSNPQSRSCNRGAIPDQVIHLVGMTCSPLERALNAAELRQYLVYGPVEIEFESDGIGGITNHVALITAISDSGVTTFLDPWPEFGQSSPTLAQLQAHYHWGPWVRSYVQFAAM